LKKWVNIGKLFSKKSKTMENIEFINYIQTSLKDKLGEVIETDRADINQIYNNIFVKYKYQNTEIQFVSDRSFLTVELIKDGYYKMLHEFDETLIDIKTNKESLNVLISALSKKDTIL
jgi:hypothetical protein